MDRGHWYLCAGRNCSSPELTFRESSYANTVLTTAILHAGRLSLDEKRPVYIKQQGDEWVLE